MSDNIMKRKTDSDYEEKPERTKRTRNLTYEVLKALLPFRPTVKMSMGYWLNQLKKNGVLERIAKHYDTTVKKIRGTFVQGSLQKNLDKSDISSKKYWQAWLDFYNIKNEEADENSSGEKMTIANLINSVDEQNHKTLQEKLEEQKLAQEKLEEQKLEEQEQKEKLEEQKLEHSWIGYPEVTGYDAIMFPPQIIIVKEENKLVFKMFGLFDQNPKLIVGNSTLIAIVGDVRLGVPFKNMRFVKWSTDKTKIITNGNVAIHQITVWYEK